MIVAMIFALLIVAFIIHAFYAIELSYWQRTAIRCAISHQNPREALRKLEILSSIEFGEHVRRVTWFRSPRSLYARLPEEAGRVW
jgi:hypothetical protein